MLQSESNANAVGRPLVRETCQQIGDRFQLDRDWRSGKFRWGCFSRSEIRDGRGHEQEIMVGPEFGQEVLEILAGLIRGDFGMLFEIIMDGRFDGAQQHLHRKASLATCSGQSQAHFAAGTVQDASNGVQVLKSRAGRD